MLVLFPFMLVAKSEMAEIVTNFTSLNSSVIVARSENALLCRDFHIMSASFSRSVLYLAKEVFSQNNFPPALLTAFLVNYLQFNMSLVVLLEIV